MNAGRLIILRASRLSPRDATRRMSATEPSQQQLRRSSGSVAAALIQPSTPRSWQHLEEGRELLLLRSISSVVAAPAPSQQRQQATVVSRDDERSTGARLLKLFRVHPKRDL